MKSSLQDQLREWRLQNYMAPSKKPNITEKEKLSVADWNYIMGTNRATYCRHRGAYRQRG